MEYSFETWTWGMEYKGKSSKYKTTTCWGGHFSLIANNSSIPLILIKYAHRSVATDTTTLDISVSHASMHECGVEDVSISLRIYLLSNSSFVRFHLPITKAPL